MFRANTVSRGPPVGRFPGRVRRLCFSFFVFRFFAPRKGVSGIIYRGDVAPSREEYKSTRDASRSEILTGAGGLANLRTSVKHVLRTKRIKRTRGKKVFRPPEYYIRLGFNKKKVNSDGCCCSNELHRRESYIIIIFRFTAIALYSKNDLVRR